MSVVNKPPCPTIKRVCGIDITAACLPCTWDHVGHLSWKAVRCTEIEYRYSITTDEIERLCVHWPEPRTHSYGPAPHV